MDIIHLSDLHFGDAKNPFNEKELSEALSEYIVNNTKNPILILSGDITIKGKKVGYEIASTFIDNLIVLGGVRRGDFCICPGNHDIVEGDFHAFDTFVYSARRDNNLSFNKESFKVLDIQGILFVVLNSSFHLNHKYGLIDDGCFNQDLLFYGDMKKILVVHHHILNQFDDDTSAIRNGYDLVRFIENNGIDLVLHGHQHTEQYYQVGKNTTPVISARSGNFKQSGYLNAFNHYKIIDDDIAINILAFERSRSKIHIRKLLGNNL